MPWKKASKELSEYLEASLSHFNCQKKIMFGSPAYFVNSNMFTGVFQDDIFIRLSEQDLSDITALNDEVVPFAPMEGRIMKEYVVLPESLFSHHEEFEKWLTRSYQYASGLPEKIAKKKSKK
jgi:TfoX/Sxy family transcriptional regulator of competence genes